MTSSNNSPKIFIVGVGRSGTSLLQSMIGSHSQIEFLPETGFLRRFVVPRTLANVRSLSGLDAVYENLEQDDRIARLELPWEQANLDENDENLDLKLYEWILESKSKNAKLVGDKDPKLIETIDLIMQLWPDSKVIHIYRDPRDVLLSKKKASWSKARSIYLHLVASNVQFQLGEYFEQKYGAQSIHVVRYEDLLQKPEQILTPLSDWLGVDFENAMLDFGKTASKLVSTDEMQWKSETLGPLLQSNSKKWMTELSTFESRLAELCCSAVMNKGGYEKDSRRLGLASRVMARAFSIPLRLVANLYKKLATAEKQSRHSKIPRLVPINPIQKVNGIVHWHDATLMLRSVGLRIDISRDHGKSFRTVGRLTTDLIRSLASRSKLGCRLVRSNVKHCLKLRDKPVHDHGR